MLRGDFDLLGGGRVSAGPQRTTVEIDAKSGEAITLPDAALLFQGDFRKSGFDLVVEDAGHRVVIRDYFRVDKRPDLKSPEGGWLSDEVVSAMSVSEDGERFAQTAAPAAATAPIGRVETVSGSATAIRNGVSVALNQGDLVYKGDTVQTDRGSALGITFIDGSTFSLSAGARMVLNEMVYNPGGAQNSALISLVQGSVAFLAGQVAKTGDMRVDTPVATMGIRGTTVKADIDANNGLTNFAVLPDPDGTVGSFVLYRRGTNDVIATVSQAGFLTVIAPDGSTFSRQLTAAEQQDQALAAAVVYQIYSLGAAAGFPTTDPGQPVTPVPGSQGGSSGTPPIAFTLINSSTTAGTGTGTGIAGVGGSEFGAIPQTSTTSFDGTSPAVTSAPEITVSRSATPSGGNPAAPFDSTITFVAFGPVLTAGDGVAVGDAAPTSVEGRWGTFTIRADGTYTYVAGRAAALAQGAEAKDVFTYQVGAGDDARFVTLTFDIRGVNDAPEAEDFELGLPQEARFDSSAAGAGRTSFGSVLDYATDIDVEPAGAPSARVTTLAGQPVPNGGEIAVQGLYGTLTLRSDGTFAYVATKAAPAGAASRDTFSYTMADARGATSTADITFLVRGINDVAIIEGDTSGTLIEAGGFTNSVPGNPAVASGALTSEDPDRDESNLFQAASGGSVRGLGTFTVDPAGNWTFTPNQTNATVQALNVNESTTDTFVVRTVDGTQQIVTVTIGGANDLAVISGNTSGSVGEAGGLANGTAGTPPTAAGILTAVDPDAGQANGFEAATGMGVEGHGSFSVTAAGAWTYTLDNSDVDVQALNVGDTLTDTFVVRALDGTEQGITVTINGANDAAVISGKTADTVVEAGTPASTVPGTPTAQGTLTAVDVDDPDNAFQAVTTPAVTAYGTFTITASGQWTYELDNDNEDVQGLNIGQFLEDSFVVKSADGTEQTITIRIDGTTDNLPPIIGAAPSADGPEGSGSFTLDLLAGADDPDGDDAALEIVDLDWTGGEGLPPGVSLSGSVLTIDANDPFYDSLPEGGSSTASFAYKVKDEAGATTEQTASFTVEGRNDAPVAGDAAPESTTDQSEPVTIRLLANASDVDDGDVLSVDEASVVVSSRLVGSSGSSQFTDIAFDIDDATGELTIDPAQFAALQQSQTLEVSFGYTVEDGNGGSDTAEATLTVNGANDAAIIDGDLSGTVVEAGTPASTVPGTPTAQGTLTAADVDDPDNAFQAVTTPVATAYGNFTITASGQWTYELDNDNADVEALEAGQFLEDSFVVKSADGTEQTITISIEGATDAVNRPPETGAASATGDEDTLIAVQMSGTDPDSGGSVASFTITGVTNGTVYLDATGATALGANGVVGATGNAATVYVRPSANFSGQVTFQYAATDDTGATDPTPATATVTVAPVSDAPGLTVADASGAAGAFIQLDIMRALTDPSETFSALVISGLPVGAVLTDGEGGNSFTAAAGQTSVDVNGWTLADLQIAPPASFAGSLELTVAASSLDSPAPAATTTDTLTVIVASNEAPVASDDDADVNAGQTVSAGTRALGVLGNDMDPDSGHTQALVVVAARSDGTSSAGLNAIAQADVQSGRSLSATLGGLAGYGEGTLAANDDGSTAAIDITSIFGPNGLNFFGQNFTTLYVNNNGNITFTSPLSQYVPSQIQGSAGNPIIAPFWYDVDTRPATSGRLHWDLDTANRVFTATWDHVGHYNNIGTSLNSFQLKLIDEGNGDFDVIFRYSEINNGGLSSTTSAARAGYSAGQNGFNSYELPQSGNLAQMAELDTTAGNTTVDGVYAFLVRFGQVSGPDEPVASGAPAVIQGVYGTLTLRADGTYSYVADNAEDLGPGERVTDSFTYTVRDPAGGVDQAKLSFEVVGSSGNQPPVNTVPTVAQTVDEGSTLVFDAAGGNRISIADPDVASGTQTVSLSVTQGVLTLSTVAGLTFADGEGDGTSDAAMTFSGTLAAINAALDGLLYDPGSASGSSGTLTIVTVDGAGPTALSDQDSVSILINARPETNAATGSGVGGSDRIPIILSGSDDGAVSSFTLTGLASLPGTLHLTLNGSETITDGGSVTALSGNSATIYFSPDEGFSGSATFTYAATDDDGLADITPATATIDVNLAPTTDDVSASGIEDQAARIALILSGADEDGSVVSFTIEDLSSLDGTLYLSESATTAISQGDSIASSGTSATIWFDPDDGFNGSATFTYAALDDDGALDRSPATVTITIAPEENQPPVVNVAASDGAGSVVEDGTGQLIASGTVVASDEESPSLRFSVVGGTPAHPADYQFRLDTVTVFNSTTSFNTSSTIYQEGFGADEPDVNGQPGSGFNGSTFQPPLAELDGHLLLTDDEGFFDNNTLGPDPFRTVVSTLQSSTDGTTGLAKSKTFTVRALYDLDEPDDLRETYSLRLQDLASSNSGDDMVEIVIRKSSAGVFLAEFRDLNFDNGNVTSLSRVPLDPPSDATQIALRLMHEGGTSQVMAAFDYLNASGSVVGTHLFADSNGSPATGLLFGNENFTRASVLAFAPDTADSFIEGEYGTLAVNQAGQWNYNLANSSAAVQALAGGQEVFDTFEIVATDADGLASEPFDVEVKVTGANDAPVAEDDVVTDEIAAGGSYGQDSISGVLVNVSDIDTDDEPGVLQVAAGDGDDLLFMAAGDWVDGEYGRLRLNADGSYLYEAIYAEGIAFGETEVDVFTYRVGDGHGGEAEATLTFDNITAGDGGGGGEGGPPETASSSTGARANGGRAAVGVFGYDEDGSVTGFRVTSLPETGVFSTDSSGSFIIGEGDIISASGTMTAGEGEATIWYQSDDPDFSGVVTFNVAAIDDDGFEDDTPGDVTINVFDAQEAGSHEDGVVQAGVTLATRSLAAGIGLQSGTGTEIPVFDNSGTFEATFDLPLSEQEVTEFVSLVGGTSSQPGSGSFTVFFDDDPGTFTRRAATYGTAILHAPDIAEPSRLIYALTNSAAVDAFDDSDFVPDVISLTSGTTTFNIDGANDAPILDAVYEPRIFSGGAITLLPSGAEIIDPDDEAGVGFIELRIKDAQESDRLILDPGAGPVFELTVDPDDGTIYRLALAASSGQQLAGSASDFEAVLGRVKFDGDDGDTAFARCIDISVNDGTASGPPFEVEINRTDVRILYVASMDGGNLVIPESALAFYQQQLDSGSYSHFATAPASYNSGTHTVIVDPDAPVRQFDFVSTYASTPETLSAGLNGSSRNDVVAVGTPGNDIVLADDDTVFTYTGRAGSDVFVLSQAEGVMRITDFLPEDDVIDISFLVNRIGGVFNAGNLALESDRAGGTQLVYDDDVVAQLDDVSPNDMPDIEVIWQSGRDTIQYDIT